MKYCHNILELPTEHTATLWPGLSLGSGMLGHKAGFMLGELWAEGHVHKDAFMPLWTELQLCLTC